MSDLSEPPFGVDIGTVKQTFELLFNHSPDEATIEILVRRGILSARNRTQLARRIIACTDRNTATTPYFIHFSATDLRQVNTDGFEFFFDEADVAVGQPVGLGSYELHVKTFLKRHLRPGMMVADIGANIGFLTLLASRLVGQNGHVFAIEANSQNCRLIALNVQRNNATNVTLLPFGLGKEIGAAFFCPALGSNGGLQANEDDSVLNVNFTVVPIIPLDLILNTHLDLIKIDVEGAEGSIFEGARRVLETSRPIVLSEFCPLLLEKVSGMRAESYLNMFKELNYEAFVLERNSSHGGRHKIDDISQFLADYGSPHRMEDVAFLPSEYLVKPTLVSEQPILLDFARAGLSTQVGNFAVNGGVSTTGTAGVLTYGPYWRLEQGRYVLRCRGHAPMIAKDSGRALLSITGDSGARTILQHPTDLASELMVEFVLDKHADKVEFVLWVYPETSFTFFGFELTILH